MTLTTPSGYAAPSRTVTNERAPRCILVIEDERDIAELIALHLADLPAQVTLANDGPGGLQLALRKPWDAIVQRQLRVPLGLPGDFRYYTYPKQAVGLVNPLIAGGLRASVDEYARVLGLVFQKGLVDGQRLVSAALFDLQAREPYPNVVIGASPARAAGLDFRYGLTAWLECTPPATGCNSLDSAGAFGFTPWIDRDANYYAILGMELSPGSGTQFALPLEQQLKPLIAQAVARLP